MHGPNADDAPFVRPDVAAMLAMLEAMQEVKMTDMSAPDARAAYLAMRYVADADPTELAVIRDLTCSGPAGDIKLRYYDARESREPGPAIVFYHGGGFVIGDLETHHPFCTEMAKQLDLPVVAVDYRLAPEHPFPAAPEDCIAAARWLAASPAELGLEVTGLIPCGDSAGGNMTLIVTLALLDEPAAVPVVAQIPIYPATTSGAEWESYKSFADGFLLTMETMEWFMAHYAPEQGHSLYECVGRDLSRLPPTLLVTASLDPLRDQGRAFAAALIEAGVPTSFYEARGNVHGFICLRKGVPSSARDVDILLGHAKALLAAL